jgi:hypothetical protein
MSKKYFLISIVLAIGLAGIASAQGDLIGRKSWWSDRGTGHDWSDPNNWWTADHYDAAGVTTYIKVTPNEVPEGNTPAYVGKGGAHTPYPPDLNSTPPPEDPCITSGTFNPYEILVGGGYSLDPAFGGSVIHFDDPNWDPDPNHTLYMSGGTVNVGEPVTLEIYGDIYSWYPGAWYGRWWGLGGNVYIGTVGWRESLLWPLDPNEPSGTMVMSGGEFNVGGHMEVGAWEEAHGTLDMTSGTINITQGLYCPASLWGNNILTGQVNLHGGTINARYFHMIGAGQATGNLDITEGKLVLGRNEVETIEHYVSGGELGMSITTYGTDHGEITGGQRAALSVDYDVSYEGKTTISATLTDPCQAWNPNPPDGAANAKGLPSDIQRPVLSWSDGNDAATHEVYFGTSFAEVDGADNTDTTGIYIGSQGLADVNWTVDRDLPPLATYYWRIDEVNTVTVKGEVWDFTVANLGKASFPNPAADETGVSTDVILSWTAGIFVSGSGHQVYFGTNRDDVNDATTSVDPNNVYQGAQAGTTFDVKNIDVNALEFSSTYYWRVDESNGLTTYKGNVWSFTTDSHLTVDDFDSYVNQTALWNVWNDYWVNGSDSGINVEKDPTFVRDGNAVKFTYENATTSSKDVYIGSWMDANIADLAIGPDWTISDARAMVLYFYGDSTNKNVAGRQLWVELGDTSSNTGYVLYGGDANDVNTERWHEWNIDLADFNSAGVSLANLDSIKVGAGGTARTGQSSKGKALSTVYFDDVQLWPQRCLSSAALAAADFTGDCFVDGYDLEIMARDWLMVDYNVTGLTGILMGFPPPGDANYDLAWVTGKIGTGALHLNLDDPCDTNPFDQGDDYVKIPPMNINSNTMSFTVWANSSGIQRDDGGLFFCSYLDDPHPNNTDFTQSGFVLGLGGDNWLNYNWQNDNKTYSWDPVPDFNLPNHSWTFCALTIADDRARIFIKKDGEPMRWDENLVSHGMEAFGIPSRLGDHKGRRFSGALDDLRIYGVTLDPCQVQYLAYEGAIGDLPDDANLVAHYLFDDGSGLFALDEIGDQLNPQVNPSQANICGDGVEALYHRYVNMRDFGCLADVWLTNTLWPQ